MSRRNFPHYRLVAIDLDDTLLNDALKITDRTRETIARVRQVGVEVTIATGRMYSSALPYIRALGLDVPVITYQGALIKNALSGETILHRPVPRDEALKVIKVARQQSIHLNMYIGDELYMEDWNDYGRGYAQLAGVEPRLVSDLTQLLANEPTKLLMIEEETRLDALAGKLKRNFLNKLYITKSKPQYLEFMHYQATKGIAVAALATKLGVEREQVIAIGDSYNDLEMFQYAGCAVVMGNARDEVKSYADFITTSNNEDGVAAALEELILKGL